MRIDKTIIPFSAINIDSTRTTIVDINMQEASAFAILLEITSHAGTATNTFVDVVPRVGSSVAVFTASSDAIGHPVDLTNQTGIFALNHIGAPGAAKTQFLGNGYWIPNGLQEMRISANGVGVGHTITGNIYLFRRFGE